MSQLKLPQNPEFHFNIRDFIWQRERAAEQTKAKHCIKICAYRPEKEGKSKSVHIWLWEADNDYKGRNIKVWRTMMKRRETRQKNADCADISPLSHFINISETSQE